MKNFISYNKIIITALLAAVPVIASAEWTIVNRTAADGTVTQTAHAVNKAGYSLDIYRDVNNVVRAYFSMNSSDRLNGKNCPTFQIDQLPAQNRSINDAPCLSQPPWAEFIIGYITGDEVASTMMHNLLNGNTITYRFILRNTGYGETSFSLAGSKRVVMEVLGNNLVVAKEKDLP